MFHDFVDENSGLHNENEIFSNDVLLCGVDFAQSFSPDKLGVDVSTGDRLYHQLDRCGKLINEWGLISPSITAKISPYIYMKDHVSGYNLDNNDAKYCIRWKCSHDGNDKDYLLKEIRPHVEGKKTP